MKEERLSFKHIVFIIIMCMVFINVIVVCTVINDKKVIKAEREKENKKIDVVRSVASFEKRDTVSRFEDTLENNTIVKIKGIDITNFPKVVLNAEFKNDGKISGLKRNNVFVCQNDIYHLIDSIAEIDSGLYKIVFTSLIPLYNEKNIFVLRYLDGKNTGSTQSFYTLNFSEYKYDFEDYGSNYLSPFSSIENLSKADLIDFDEEYLIYAKNEIYARHGMIFNDEELRKYFYARSWYYESTFFSENPDNLNKYERFNIKLIDSILRNKFN